MHIVRLTLVTIFLSCSLSLSVKAQELVPLTTSNQNPLVAIYGLPATAPGTILSSGQAELELRVDLASSCSTSDNSDESILLDGETTRYTLALRYGIRGDFEIGMEIPYVGHSEGFLDNFIYNWHDFFGLPQGERDTLEEDQLTYAYQRNDSSISLDDEESGFGDLRFTGAWHLVGKHKGDTHHLALRSSLKLPTGDDEKLLGSGSTDLALWLSSSHFYQQESVGLFASAGMIFLTDGDLLAEQQRNIVGFGSLGAAWQIFDAVALKLQFDGHTGFYDDSDFAELGPSVQLVMGGSIAMGNDTSLDLAVSEDIVVDSAPDVVFHLALRTRF